MVVRRGVAPPRTFQLPGKALLPIAASSGPAYIAPAGERPKPTWSYGIQWGVSLESEAVSTVWDGFESEEAHEPALLA